MLRAAERDQILSRFSFRISKLEYYLTFVASLTAKFRKLQSLQSERCWFNLPASHVRSPSYKCEAEPRPYFFLNCSQAGTCVLRGCGIIERTGLGNKENFAYTNWVVIKIKGTLLVFEARKITKKGETLGAVSNLISNIVKSILHHFGEI